MERYLVGVGAALAAWGAAQSAEAGAWIAPEKGQIITSLTVGYRGDADTYSEADTLYEQPLSPRTSVVVQPRYSFADDDNASEGEILAGMKMVVIRAPEAVAAVQVGAIWQSAPELGCGEGGGEVRALGGLSHGEAFTNLEAGWRAQSGGCESLRLDFTFGQRFGESWLALGQAFLDHDGDGDPVVKAQASLVRFGADEGGLQLGLRFRLDGDDREPALVLGWWRAPRW